MSDTKRPRPAVLLLGGLVRLNVALVAGLAFRQAPDSSPTGGTAVPAPQTSVSSPSSPTSGSASASGSPSASSSGSESPSGTPSASTTPSESTAPDGGSPDPSGQDDPRRVMAVSSSTLAWRAEVEPCGQDSSVEVSTNGGKSWRTTSPKLGSILRLKSFDNQAVFAIGADDGCRASFASVGSPTGRWLINRGMTSDIWYRVPSDPSTVHAPGGATSTPCGDDLIALAGRGTYEATAVCVDGRVRTKRQGRAWTTVLSSSGVVAVNADDNRFTAARVMDGCDGLVVQHFDVDGSGLAEKSAPCWKVDRTASDPVAVASRDDTTWLWVGDRVVVR